ncbi:MAG TPA: beta-propeller fold lactonase family protein [Opitutaceae bacterium]|nr:beta-propeller fold lactonase family protein [Opitutaceae bacterium]
MKPLLLAALCLASVGWAGGAPTGPGATTEPVGRAGANRTVLPVNQVVTPVGRQVELPGLRPQALALSPDGRLLVASGKTSELVVLDPDTGAIRQQVALPIGAPDEPPPGIGSESAYQPDEGDQVSFTGLIFSPDGRSIFLSNVNGSLKVFTVAADGAVAPARSISLPPTAAPRRRQEIPAGLALSADGRRLYVCGNLSNTLLELDPATGRVLRTFATGVAPYDVALVGGKAYVSNWGGRRPRPGDLTGPAGRGTEVRVDPVRYIASEGSVSVIDLAAPPGPARPPVDIITGLHACALAVSPDRRYVVCANAGSDNLSVIDPRTDRVVETVGVKAEPGDLFGASPNALAFDRRGRTLYVANGTQNAVAVVRFDPKPRNSQLLGLIPVGWFPGALVYDRERRMLAVANVKGHAREKRRGRDGRAGFNSLQFSGSVSLVPLPKERDLPDLSETVARNLRHPAIAASRLPPRPGQPPRPVPERIGEPSVFRHVVYIIKENRTYDQVLGDEPRGNGDAALCIFGEAVTPNEHRLVREFALLDNTYCAGILSADGHQWSTTAFATDYMEKSFAGFPRSYPDGMGENENDALAYSPAGFLWDNALAHGRTLRDYGEFAAPAVRWRDPRRPGTPGFMDCYRCWKGETADVTFESHPSVESLRPYLPTHYVGWALNVPDQFRADVFIRELQQFEAKDGWPDLILICLPNDHTCGTNECMPTPAAYVADNDLALGRIVEAISHSRFWPETVIFAIEDDPQSGWDHVSGYRTTAYCISPYTRRGAEVGTQYNTTSLVRTIEQILGLPPMNQFDASATPMFDCFTDQPDFTPFTAVANQVPLDRLNPAPQAINDPVLRRDAELSAKMDFREVDRAPEDALNRVLWRAMKGSREPYPAWAVTRVAADRDD